jgi:hypothetical protein
MITFQPPAPAKAQWLAMDAAHNVERMDPAKVAYMSEEYETDIRLCLNEAIKSATLRTISADQLRAWTGPFINKLIDKEDMAVARTFLAYTNGSGQRIVIALDDNRQPVTVINVDATIIKAIVNKDTYQ